MKFLYIYHFICHLSIRDGLISLYLTFLHHLNAVILLPLLSLTVSWFGFVLSMTWSLIGRVSDMEHFAALTVQLDL